MIVPWRLNQRFPHITNSCGRPFKPSRIWAAPGPTEKLQTGSSRSNGSPKSIRPSCRRDVRIGEIAEQLELNLRTLRFHESVGLLPEPRRTPGGYRDYGNDDLERVRFIKSAQRLGLSLDDIKEILAFKDRGDLPCDYVLSVIDKEADALDQKIAELERLRRELKSLRNRARRIPKAELAKRSCVCHIIENQDLLIGPRSS
jgi:DNA-binding transcriptional MerR regulator